MPPVKQFTVIRDQWLRGDEEGQLLVPPRERNAGKMCCLGFLGLACGYRPDEIEGVGDPSHFHSRDDRHLWPAKLATVVVDDSTGYDASVNTALCERIVRINDGKAGPADYHEVRDDEDRERQLTALFAEAGIKVTFA